MTEATIAQHLALLTQAVVDLARNQGTRLDREQLAQRLRCHPNSITRWLRTVRDFPRPDRHGYWLLADVLKWEAERPASAQE